MNDGRRLVLVAGATGYIGRRLVAELVAAGHQVRCLARTPGKLDAESRRGDVEVVTGDVLDRGSLTDAFRDVDAAYYLVHSIGSESDWQDRDRTAAENFRNAAASAGVEQMVYLGGLGDDTAGELSPHLTSRHEVGRVLAAGAVPLTELRAEVVIGWGSASFEMLRHLVEVLPVMTTPRWVETRVQPIAVRDVLVYLTDVLGNRDAYGRVLEIGGHDVVTYCQMMDIYAEVAGLRKRVIAPVPVPVLSPRLSSLWVGLVTPIPAELARPLVDSLVNEVVVRNHAIDDVVAHRPICCRDAIELALRRAGDLELSTHWTDAELYGRSPADPIRPIPTGPAPPSSPTGRPSGRWPHPKPSSTRSLCWAASEVGSSAPGYGRSAVGSIGWSAVWACAEGGAIRPSCASATWSTSGASKRWSLPGSCGFEPRCACRETPGSNGRSPPSLTVRVDCSSSGPCSGREAWPAAPTGPPSYHSTVSSSARSPVASSRTPPTRPLRVAPSPRRRVSTKPKRGSCTPEVDLAPVFDPGVQRTTASTCWPSGQSSQPSEGTGVTKTRVTPDARPIGRASSGNRVAEISA